MSILNTSGIAIQNANPHTARAMKKTTGDGIRPTAMADAAVRAIQIQALPGLAVRRVAMTPHMALRLSAQETVTGLKSWTAKAAAPVKMNDARQSPEVDRGQHGDQCGDGQ